MTVKSSARVGYLNLILAQGGGNLNKSIFKSSNARALPGGGMLMFRIDRRIKLFIFLLMQFQTVYSSGSNYFKLFSRKKVANGTVRSETFIFSTNVPAYETESNFN